MVSVVVVAREGTLVSLVVVSLEGPLVAMAPEGQADPHRGNLAVARIPLLQGSGDQLAKEALERLAAMIYA